MIKAVVLAGGLGTRLRSKIHDIPKPMALIAGRPFLEFVLDKLIAGGIRDIVLSVGYRADLIEAHFGSVYRGAVLRYAIEPEPLGTGGAIAFSLRGEASGPAVVVNGDTLLDIDFSALTQWYQNRPCPIAIVLREVPDISRYGAVVLSGENVTGFIEKGSAGPGLINAGIYLLQSNIFAELGLTGNFSFETDLIQRHCATLQPRAYVSHGYFIDIGTPEDFERASQELRPA